MVFIAIVIGSIMSLLAALSVTRRKLLSATHTRKANILTWGLIAVALLPAWFFAFIVGGTVGGGIGARTAELLGTSEEAFVAFGIFSGLSVCLFAIITVVGLTCAAAARRLLN